MLHRMFTVHDAKAEAYLPLFTFPTRGQAIRTFSDTVNGKEGVAGKCLVYEDGR